MLSGHSPTPSTPRMCIRCGNLPASPTPRAPPLAHLVAVWQRLASATDKGAQIIPRSVAMVEHDEPGYYLDRFG